MLAVLPLTATLIPTDPDTESTSSTGSPTTTTVSDSDAVLASATVVPDTIATTNGGADKPFSRTLNMPSKRALAVMSPTMRKLALQQPFMDEVNDAFTPRLYERFEVVPKLGRVTLGTELFRGEFSIIFALVEYPQFVIKYQTDCECRSHEVHPLLPDFWMGSIASSVGVGPNPQCVSPAALLPPFETIKTMFRISGERRHKCVKKDAVVRYMVMDRVGPSLHSLAPRPDGTYVDVHTGLEMTVEILKLVQRLHAAGIIHGDVHGGNVCESASGDELTLVDFGSALFLDAESDRPIRPRLSWDDIALTPWQLEGLPFSRRDDVYKVLVTSMFAIVGTELEKVISAQFELGLESFLRWKLLDIGFDVPHFDPLDAIEWMSADQKRIVKNGLERLVVTVCELESVTTPIPYADMIATLKELSIMLTPTPTTTTTTTTTTTITPSPAHDDAVDASSLRPVMA